MKVAIVGYGKMGKMIEQILQERGHNIVAVIDRDNPSDIHHLRSLGTEVAIEFSTPMTAFDNICNCLDQGVAVVSGTTAWLDRLPEVEQKVNKLDGGFFYAPNYSIGVNLFFKTCERLSQLMNGFEEYEVSMEEIHHTEKLDAPSGTAIAAASTIISKLERKNKWTLEDQDVKDDEISISAKRLPDVPGTHSVHFFSEIDSIEVKHTAYSREGFAKGAVQAAEWMVGRKGIFGMDDLLGL